MPRFSHRRSESLTLPVLENFDGMVMATTLSAPNASTASARVRAESMPPEEPTTALRKPQRRA